MACVLGRQGVAVLVLPERLDPPHMRGYTCHELDGPHRLGHVVVRAGLEPARYARLVVAAAHEDNEHDGIPRADLATYLDPGHVGKPPVEEHGHGSHDALSIERFRRGGADLGLEALAFDNLPEQGGGFRAG